MSAEIGTLEAMKCDTGDDILEEDHSGRLSVDGAEDDGPRLLDEVDLPRMAPNSLFFPRNLVKQHAPDAGLDGDGQRLLGGHGRLVSFGCATLYIRAGRQGFRISHKRRVHV